MIFTLRCVCMLVVERIWDEPNQTNGSSLCLPLLLRRRGVIPPAQSRPLWIACDCTEIYYGLVSHTARWYRSESWRVVVLASQSPSKYDHDMDAKPWTSVCLSVRSSSIESSKYFELWNITTGQGRPPNTSHLNLVSIPCFAFSLACARGCLWREKKTNHTDTLQLLIATTHRLMPFSTISIYAIWRTQYSKYYVHGRWQGSCWMLST